MNSCHLFDDLYGNNLSDEKRFRIQTISGALEKKIYPIYIYVTYCRSLFIAQIRWTILYFGHLV